MKTALCVLLMLIPAWAKKDTDYPLTAHIVAVERVDNMDISPVSNINTGVITGTTVTGDVYERVEIKINGATYITHGRRVKKLEVGSDVPARMGKHHRVDVLVGDKERHLYIVGKQE